MTIKNVLTAALTKVMKAFPSVLRLIDQAMIQATDELKADRERNNPFHGIENDFKNPCNEVVIAPHHSNPGLLKSPKQKRYLN